ncbi:hypothetical protein AKJ57_05300 [candidate division MSBL1 archaeon SCGC-AAA259A05]|uniref:DUF116 domain-containing protein n=1 Tax=candidate division MSBL1 archaeon SCGC-AAA259A05 TaxID=1698259 RepID=A0A133U5J2_9EURY|nr:hypothetical protein AKJ57_05300 [candidate division MSBL1 archaeon SCGC-AAA259A05]
MTYEFDFDLTGVSRSFFREIAKFSEKRGIHQGLGEIVGDIVDRFKIQEMTGIPVSDITKVVNDMIDIHAKNLSQEEEFKETSDRALFLPHCARKFMDNRCQAEFDQELSTYRCKHCSEDCLINSASQIGEERGYDVYVLPGGSCIPKIINGNDYDGVVGVACSDEIQLGMKYLERADVLYQGVPLLKNGCSNTEFNVETFKQTLQS